MLKQLLAEDMKIRLNPKQMLAADMTNRLNPEL
jgi:hypothetical protein